MNITAVIVARKGSKRIPNKLHQTINGEKMFCRKIKQLNVVPQISKIIVGSDDESIKEEVENLGAIFIKRPDEFCDEISRTPNEMVQNMLSCFESDFVLWSHPTNPMTNSTHYWEAINSFLIGYPEYDSLFSASVLRGHFWDEQCRPINFNPRSPVHKIAAELPPIYAQNGAIFIRSYDSMKIDGCFIGSNPNLYQMSSKNGWDIDEQWQLDCARAICK